MRRGFFNTLEGDQYTVTKRSANREKIKNEYQFYYFLPREMQHWFVQPYSYAKKVCAAISGLGFRNRGVKYSTGFRVLRTTKAPAMLVECCFVDDRDDVQLYDCQAMAEAIVFGITGQRVQVQQPDADQEPVAPEEETAVGDGRQLKRVQLGAYYVTSNAEAVLARAKAAGFDDAIIVNA